MGKGEDDLGKDEGDLGKGKGDLGTCNLITGLKRNENEVSHHRNGTSILLALYHEKMIVKII